MMGGRDHSCEVCGLGGMNDPGGECECPKPEDASAQDVVDALRFALMAQKDPAEAIKLVDALLEFAPGSDGDRGIKLLLDMIAEGSLKVALT